MWIHTNSISLAENKNCSHFGALAAIHDGPPELFGKSLNGPLSHLQRMRDCISHTLNDPPLTLVCECSSSFCLIIDLSSRRRHSTHRWWLRFNWFFNDESHETRVSQPTCIDSVRVCVWQLLASSSTNRQPDDRISFSDARTIYPPMQANERTRIIVFYRMRRAYDSWPIDEADFRV